MPYNIHCEQCGHEFEVEKWHPGMPCVKCKAADTIPQTKLGGELQGPPGLSSVDDDRPRAKAGWKNNPVVAGVAIVVIILTWVALGSWGFKKPKRMKIEVWAVCTECKERVKKFTEELWEGGAKCEKCGKERCVYTEYECRGKKNKECGNTFAYMPPPPPMDRSRDSKKWEKMSEEERNKAEMEVNRKMEEYEQAQTEASKCPKCKSSGSPVYTEEQKKKFKELRAES